MTIFQHKTEPITIGYSEYSKLSQFEKNNFRMINATSNNTTNHINNTTVKNETSDVLGLGTVAAVTVGIPLAIVGGFFGLFDD